MAKADISLFKKHLLNRTQKALIRQDINLRLSIHQKTPLEEYQESPPNALIYNINIQWYARKWLATNFLVFLVFASVCGVKISTMADFQATGKLSKFLTL